MYLCIRYPRLLLPAPSKPRTSTHEELWTPEWYPNGVYSVYLSCDVSTSEYINSTLYRIYNLLDFYHDFSDYNKSNYAHSSSIKKPTDLLVNFAKSLTLLAANRTTPN